MNANNWIKTNYGIVLILFLAALLRFYHIDFQSIWLDEIHTMIEANPNATIPEVYNSITVSEQMPPLYFYSIYFLFKIFGYTTLVARVYSAVLGIISVFALYKLGKELFSKQTGLIAAWFLCVNPFHLFYSQEARPYIFLLITTIISFYALVKFLKDPIRKKAIYFGIAAGAMLLSHFFGMFVLLSQGFILLIFLLLSEKKNRMAFFINSAIGGLLSLLLFVPAFKILIKVSEIKEFWIPPTTIDTIKQIFKDFCGNSDFVLILSILGIVYFIVMQLRDQKTLKTYSDVVANKQLLSSILLGSWIIIVLAVPIIRSYLTIPMIVSRYFIVILPALILVVAIAVERVKNKIITLVFVALFSVGCLYEITLHSNYYNSISKAQFREITQFVNDNNQENDPVYTSLGWYFSYFFNNDEVKTSVTGTTLQDYINEVRKDSTQLKSFWAVESRHPYSVDESTQKHLDDKFIIDKSQDYFDTWAKHYILKTPQSLKEHKIPADGVVLSNITDENWAGGVGKNYNMFLLDYSAEKETKLKKAKKAKFKDGREVVVVGYEHIGAYLHIQIQGSAFIYKDVASYPNAIEIITNE